MKLKTLIKVIGTLVVVAAVGFFSYRVGVLVGEENILRTPPPQVVNPIDLEEGERVDFSVFWEAWRNLEKHYFDKTKIDYKAMFYGAIDGMVKAVGDPYTVFFTPPETESFNEEMSGQYEGVGMVIGIKDEQLVVVSPFKGSPADLAGLKAGDKILKVDERLTHELTVEESAKLIKGPRGTTVRLLIERKSGEGPKEFSIKREKITIPTLEWETVGEDIAWLKIYQFNKIVTSEFEKAALEILNSPVKKIIVDLRNNPGGYLDKAQAVSGWFLKKGEVVTWQDMGTDKERKPYESPGPSAFLEYPTVVLINEGSASGSEIMAGALRDQRGIKLIGTKSFGKGSVQEQLTLSDESSLKVTIAKWLTPNGFSIDSQGLTPDIEVELSAEPDEAGERDTEEEDAQLQKAIEFLSGL